MTTPADREFKVLSRGYIRDKIILANFRNGLRSLKNPETGILFTEDEIARATQVGSRWWIEADAIDQQGQIEQHRAIYLSDQARMERASTKFLEDFHGELWGEAKLPATGGSGVALVPAVAGTIIVGSTTIPDPAAYQARDAAGKKYQVFIGATTPAGGVASISMAAIDTGSTTNLMPGDKLTWITKDPNMAPTCTVGSSQFVGGSDVETDAQFASRMMGNVRHKQAAGNDAHFRAWGRASSNSVEDCYVYPCALHAGSVVIALTAKRGNVAGPAARIPSAALLASATAYLVPPGSPVVPARAFVLVVPTTAQPSNCVLKLALAKGAQSGWTDVQPFPAYHATTPYVSARVSDTDFTIQCWGDAGLPGGATTLTAPDAPAIMLWDSAASVFMPLNVASIEDLGTSAFRVLLASSPGTVAVNQFVSPGIGRHALISPAIVDHFDELGPGDLFDVATDPRGGRCVRFPRTDERPCRLGGGLALRVIEALGGSSADAELDSVSYSTPSYPVSVSDGPYMLVPGQIGVYSL
jgi:hypothetical protein